MPAERNDSFRADCRRMSGKYQKFYNQIIERARSRTLYDYKEVHHIQPRSLGGSDHPTNLVDLTYREHFLVHWLLTKLHEGLERRKMVYALHCMTMQHRYRDNRMLGWRVDLSKRLLRDEWTKRASERRLAKLEAHRRELAATAAMLARTEANKALAAQWREQNGGNLNSSQQKDKIGRFLPASYAPPTEKPKKRKSRSLVAIATRRRTKRQRRRQKIAALAASPMPQV